MIGTKLGPYEIVDKLGAGGMGEVWRARDTKLEREVAIKLLPDDFADDPERLARFEREAKLLASLNHANIASIYDLDDADGKRFIAMELVEGESLAERMEVGRIALDDVLEIARQIAAALEAAHDNGVIHRDLKPANIMVTPAGEVKVLDFGLAKAYAPDGSPSDISPDISNSPTIVNATRSGMIVGTAAYMSPEQAAGAAVDNRTDIWAFGVVLYEMLSGGRLFHGESAAHVLADVLKTEPDLDRLAPETPAEIHRLVRRCLHKKAERRLHHVADARLVIEEVIAGTQDEGLPELAATAAGQGAVGGPGLALSHPRAAILAAGVLLVGIAGGWWYALSGVPGPEPLRVFDIDTGLAFFNSAAISPDGETVVVAGAEEEDGETRLYARRLGDRSLVPLADTEGGGGPFFSPEGDWVGFWVGGIGEPRHLRKASFDGAVTDIESFESGGGGTWTIDDTILFHSDEGISRIPSSGGPVNPIVSSAASTRYRAPRPLPGGRVLLQVNGVRQGEVYSDVALYTPGDDELEVLVNDADTPRFVPPNHLFYGRRGAVWRVEYDPAGNSTTGSPELVLSDVAAISDATGYWVANDGTLLYAPGEFQQTSFTGPEARPAIFDSRGVETPLPIDVTDISAVSLSPGGDRLAVERRIGGDDSIHVYEVNTGNHQPLPPARQDNERPRWSPDGDWVYFSSTDATGPIEIHRIRPDFPGEAAQFVTEGVLLDVAPDGSVLYTERGGVDLALHRPDGDREVLLNSDNEIQSARFSPNDSFLAYASNRGGTVNVYVLDLDSNVTTPVSPNGGGAPAWSADGTEVIFLEGSITLRLVFREETGRNVISTGVTDELVLMRVPVSVVEGRLRPDPPEPFFDAAVESPPSVFALLTAGIEMLADGRFISVIDPRFQESPSLHTVTVVLNWLSNFERRAATGRVP